MFQRIETMGTGGDYFFNVIVIQRFDVFLGRHLVQHFISDTSGKVAGAFFFHTQDRKADICLLQYPNQAGRHFLGSIIKGAGTSDPEKIIDGFYEEHRLLMELARQAEEEEKVEEETDGRCQAQTKSGRRCRNSSFDGSQFCRVHQGLSSL